MRLIPLARWHLVRTTLRMLYQSHPRAFVISAVASIAEPLFFPAVLLLLHQLLEQVGIAGGVVQITPLMTGAAVGIVLVLLIQRVGIIVRDRASTIVRQEAWVAISKQIMQKLPAVPYPLFENNAFQARYGLVVREASLRSITLVDSLLSSVPILVGAVALAATLITIAPLMVVVLVVIAIPAALIERRFSRAMHDLEERSAPGKLRMEALTNMQVDATWQRDVRVYRSDLLTREHAALADLYLGQLKELARRFFRLRIGAALVQVVGLGLALAAALILIQRGQLTLAGLAVLVPGIPILSGMIGAFIYHMRSLSESLHYAETLFEFLSAESFEGEPALKPQPIAYRGPLSQIRLEGVSYTYPESQQVALHPLSCTLKPGLTAIVGTNGTGKSTLVKLLASLVEPTSGAIHAYAPDGHEIPLAACAKAVLFQDPGHFPFSIRHNVTMDFEHRAGEEVQIQAALRQAGIEQAIASLPDGLDTVVGAGFGGISDLSGGQWQRLSLARLLYQDVPLLILDEPSASLDPLGERQIFALLSALGKEKIILFTTHRYDTIRQADTIAVLVDGQLAEVGTHEELERNAGAFWSLFLAQDPHIAHRAAQAPTSGGERARH